MLSVERCAGLINVLAPVFAQLIFALVSLGHTSTTLWLLAVALQQQGGSSASSVRVGEPTGVRNEVPSACFVCNSCTRWLHDFDVVAASTCWLPASRSIG